MDLEELKNIWQHYDDSLRKTRIMNEKIMRTMLQDRSKSQMGQILLSEYLSIAVAGIVLFVFLLMIGRTAEVLLPYSISIVLFTFTIFWSIYKIRYVSRVDIGNKPVTENLERIEKFKLMIAREKLWVFILTPFLVISLIPVLNKWIYNINAFDNLKDFIPRVVTAYAFIVVACIWAYKKIYFKNISAIMHNLQELQSFKNDN